MPDNNILVCMNLRIKKCILDNCNGVLNEFILYTKKEGKKNKCRIELKQCEKCGCFFIHLDIYKVFRQCKCAEQYFVINSQKEIEDMIKKRDNEIKAKKEKGKLYPKPKIKYKQMPTLTVKEAKEFKKRDKGIYAKAHTPIITGTGTPYQGGVFSPR